MINNTTADYSISFQCLVQNMIT